MDVDTGDSTQHLSSSLSPTTDPDISKVDVTVSETEDIAAFSSSRSFLTASLTAEVRKALQALDAVGTCSDGASGDAIAQWLLHNSTSNEICSMDLKGLKHRVNSILSTRANSSTFLKLSSFKESNGKKMSLWILNVSTHSKKESEHDLGD